MGERSRTYKLSPLFPEGMVTDVDAGLLKPTQAALIQDAMWSYDGDLAKRAALMYATGANPLNGRTSKVTSCVHWYDGDTAKLCLGDIGGHAAMISSYSYSFGGATTSTASATYDFSSEVWPLCVYENEVILSRPSAPQFPLIRWAGATGANTAGAGTVSIGNDDDRVQGAGTNFLTRFSEANRYISVTDDRGVVFYYRVVKVESDTLLRVSSVITLPTDTGLSWSSNAYGYMNLCASIDSTGRAEASGTTITGTGTDWVNSITAIGAGDSIGQQNVGTRWNIASVGADTTITASIAPTDWSGVKAVDVLRNLPGTVAVEHQNRLHVTGNTVWPTRVYVLPAGASLNAEFNGVDSELTPLTSSLAEFFDVPSTNDDGKVIAMVSVREPGGLAVFRDRDFYMVYGEWPSIQIMKMSAEIGCVHRNGACEIPGGVAWMGYDGVYVHRPGGGIENITEGKIGNEYRVAVRQGPTITPQSNQSPWTRSIAYVDDHLIVTVGAGSTTGVGSTTYVYNMQNKAWAKWTGFGPLSAQRVIQSHNQIEVFLGDSTSNRFLAVSPAVQFPSVTGSASGVNGTFRAVSGGNIFGPRSDYGRVIDMKLTHSVAGSSPQLDVKWGSSTAATIGSGSNPTTTRIRPTTTQMGNLVRQQALELVESSGTFTILRLKEATITQRLRRQRA